jgi:hypothetical protein
MLTLQLDRQQQHGEWQQILHITHNNNFPTGLLTRLKHKIKWSVSQLEPPTQASLNNHTKWATFTYTSPQIRKLTNIFKHTNIEIAFKYNNTLSCLSKPTPKTHPSAPYDKCGVYSLSCITCNKKYVGQTSHSLNLRHKEHVRYIKYNNPQSACALHILNNQHKYGPIEKTMTLLKPIQNTSLLTPYKHFYIQSLYKAGNLISEQNPFEPNPLIQLALNPSHPPS